MKLNEPVLKAGRIERWRPVFIASAFSSGLAWETMNRFAGKGVGLEKSGWGSVV
jgi:hypothetical protein